MDTGQRIRILSRTGFGSRTIAAILNTDPGEVEANSLDPADVPSLPTGGGGGGDLDLAGMFEPTNDGESGGVFTPNDDSVPTVVYVNCWTPGDGTGVTVDIVHPVVGNVTVASYWQSSGEASSLVLTAEIPPGLDYSVGRTGTSRAEAIVEVPRR